MAVKSQTTYHYWTSKHHGMVFSTNGIYPIFRIKKGDRVKYVGYTNDAGWPKTMNTGRIFYKSKTKKRRTWGKN